MEIYNNWRVFLVSWVFLCTSLQGVIVAEDGETKPLKVIPVDEVIKEIRQESRLTGADELTANLDKPVQVWVNRTYLGTDNAYAEFGIRYLAVRVTILNQTENLVTINGDEITLTGWGETYGLKDRPEKYHSMPVKLDREVLSINEMTTPPQLTIPQKSAASFWCLFLEVEKTNQISELNLTIPLESGGQLTHDLRSEQRARLGLTSKRIGPEGSLGLLEIQGSLNTVNAQDLADALKKLSALKVRRIVIRWSKTASEMDVDLVDWLLHRATLEPANQLYSFFPAFPDMQYLALANLPNVNAKEEIDASHRRFLFADVADAVQASLKDLFAVIDPSYIEREIRSGHPLSQRAALASLETRQDLATFENIYPMLSELYDTADESTRPFVLLAIGQQSHPQAIPMLVNIATQEDQKDAAGAMVALLRSNQQAATSSIERLYTEQAVNVPPAKQIELLTENYRREWSPYLVQALSHKSPEVRSAALKGLVAVGHERLFEFLEAALKDDSEEAQTVAFDALVNMADAESEQIAVDYALVRLAKGNVTENVLEILRRTRDQRAATLVLKQIYRSEEKSDREQLLAILEHVGDERIIRDLLKHEEEFQPEERVLIYNLVSALAMPELLEVAKRAVHSEEPILRQTGIALLTQETSDEAAEAIFNLIKDANEDEAIQICYALGRIGTRRAEELLKDYRQQCFETQNESGLDAANDGIRLWMSHSPGWNSIESAYYHSRVENYENALTYFELAVEIDPELGVGHSGIGNTLLKLKKFDEAGEAFQKAYAIDSFDGQAITGIGIVKAIQGETEEAVQFTLDSTGKFPKDDIFAYNTACVFGRAIESLRKLPDLSKTMPTIKEYEAKAIQALEKSIKYGFEEFELMRTDPDLNSLRGLPEFQKLLPN
ncbi:HEAT repeat domain-containing protein [Thalassoglobus sp.]|uniref:HEAT repeat domain-containing protein n=1 Tax=Thalassoglobus sp. TaxID=2795869 RepID=UPI003AA93E0B